MSESKHVDLSSLDIHTPNLGKDFTEHVVFSHLDDLINFYDKLPYSTMGIISGGVSGLRKL